MEDTMALTANSMNRRAKKTEEVVEEVQAPKEEVVAQPEKKQVGPHVALDSEGKGYLKLD